MSCATLTMQGDRKTGSHADAVNVARLVQKHSREAPDPDQLGLIGWLMWPSAAAGHCQELVKVPLLNVAARP